MRHLIEDTIALLGGAGIGAALMYLLDPDQGRSRRSEISSRAGEAFSSTGEALDATMHSAGDTAKSFAHRISDYAHDVAGSIGDRAASYVSNTRDSAQQAVGDARDSARHYASDAADRASRLRDKLTDRANSVWSRARNMGREEKSHPIATATGITTGTIGILALGAGLMYFMDPRMGRSRRAWARDKVMSVTRRTSRSAERYGRHLGNKMHGVAAEARRSMSPESSSREGGSA
jgi:gas vesicle protein